MQYKLSELVAKFGGRLVGADVTVSAIAPTDLAAPGEITFLSDNKYKKALLDLSLRNAKFYRLEKMKQVTFFLFEL